MADIRWLGHSRAISQVDVMELSGATDTNDEFNFTINNKTITVVAGSNDLPTVITNIVTDWNNETTPEFAEITAAADGRNVTFTADTAGKPFTLTIDTNESSASPGSATGGGSGTAEQSINHYTKTASAGPNHVDDVDNWSLNRLPVNGDDVYIENGADLLYGLDQLSGVSLTSLSVSQKWTGKIGLPVTNADASSTYDEYRPTYLQVGSTTVSIGQGDGQGSGRIKINTGSVQTTLNVYNSGTGAESGLGAIVWKGTHASNVVNILRGSLNVAPFAGETATVVTLRIGYRNSPLTDAIVRCSNGVTLTTVDISGGDNELDSNITTLTQTDGVTVLLSGNVTTLAIDGGQVFYRGTGTITTATINSGGELNFNRDLRARTVTNAVNMYDASKLIDEFGTVTFSNGFIVNGAGIEDVTVKVGHDRTFTIS